MGNGNSIYGGGQDCAQALRRFREVDAVYQSAPDTEKENHFPRRHAALMLVLSTPPQTRNDISEVMGIALHELANELMVPGPMPDAVAAALAHCHRAIENVDLRPRIRGAEPGIELATSDSDCPSEVLVQIVSEIDKLRKFADLLAYLAKNSVGKDEQSVFGALMNSVEAIKEGLSIAVAKLMPSVAMAARRHESAQS